MKAQMARHCAEAACGELGRAYVGESGWGKIFKKFVKIFRFYINTGGLRCALFNLGSFNGEFVCRTGDGFLDFLAFYG